MMQSISKAVYSVNLECNYACDKSAILSSRMDITSICILKRIHIYTYTVTISLEKMDNYMYWYVILID